MPVAVKVEPHEVSLAPVHGRRIFYPWDKLSVGDWFDVEPYDAYKDLPPSRMVGVIAAMCRKRQAHTERRFITVINEPGVRVYRIK